MSFDPQIESRLM